MVSGYELLPLSTPLPGRLLVALAQLAGQSKSLQPVSVSGDEKAACSRRPSHYTALLADSAQLCLTLVAYWDKNLKPSGF